jgi:hypothetical protein
MGSTVVKELRGTESTKKSIQKLKKSSSTKDAKATPDIILAISYRGVKFLNTITKVRKGYISHCVINNRFHIQVRQRNGRL